MSPEKRRAAPETPKASVPLGAWPALALGAALAAAQVWLAVGFIRSAAPTFDEPVHLASGYSYLKTGRYTLNVMDHPPFAEMWAAAALLPRAPQLFLQHPDWLGGRVYHYGDLFLNHNNAKGESLLNRARLFNFLTLASALAAVLVAWAWLAAGPFAAAAAAAAQAFSPALLSNLSLVTTDGAPAVLFAGACLLGREACRLEDEGRPAARRWAAAGLLAGLALASKFSMVVLPPLLFGLGLLSALTAVPRRRPSAGLWVMLGTAAFTVAAVYRFGQAGLWWEGFTATLSRLEEGRPSFFLGRREAQGRLSYFPVALLVKTPIPCLILAALGLWSLKEAPWRRGIWLWVPPAAYFAAALTAKVQIGYRHVLPVVPFLVLWSGLGAAWLRGRGPAGLAAAAVLGAWWVGGVARVHPHQLAYFNEAAGGPSRGYEVLVDSNLDWGQALKPLAGELRRLGNPPVYLSYFGTALPEEYGIRYFPVGFYSLLERAGNDADPSASGRVLLAISATNLQGTYYKDPKAFEWLKSRRPLAVAGHALFLYDLTRDEEGLRRLAELLPPDAAARLRAFKPSPA